MYLFLSKHFIAIKLRAHFAITSAKILAEPGIYRNEIEKKIVNLKCTFKI